MCQSGLPPGLAATSLRAVTTAVGVNAAAFHHHAESLWLVPASLLPAGRFEASFETGGAKKDVTFPSGGESGRQQQRKDPGFPCSYRDVWNATGRSFVLARRLR
jgi:hypothetical protein